MGAPVQGSRHIWQKAPLLQKLCWPPFHFSNKLNSNTTHSFKNASQKLFFWTQLFSKVKLCRVLSNRAPLRTSMLNLPVFWYYNHNRQRFPDPDYEHRNDDDQDLPKTTKTHHRLPNYNGMAVLHSCWCLINKALIQHSRRDFPLTECCPFGNQALGWKHFGSCTEAPLLLSHSLTLVNPFLFSFNAAQL